MFDDGDDRPYEGEYSFTIWTFKAEELLAHWKAFEEKKIIEVEFEETGT